MSKVKLDWRLLEKAASGRVRWPSEGAEVRKAIRDAKGRATLKWLHSPSHWYPGRKNMDVDWVTKGPTWRYVTSDSQRRVGPLGSPSRSTMISASFPARLKAMKARARLSDRPPPPPPMPRTILPSPAAERRLVPRRSAGPPPKSIQEILASPQSRRMISGKWNELRHNLFLKALRRTYEGPGEFAQLRGSAADETRALEDIARHRRVGLDQRNRLFQRLYAHTRNERERMLDAARTDVGGGGDNRVYKEIPHWSVQGRDLYRAQVPFKFPKQLRPTTRPAYYPGIPGMGLGTTATGRTPWSVTARHEMEHAAQGHDAGREAYDPLGRKRPTVGRAVRESVASIGDLLNIGELSSRLRGKPLEHTIRFGPNMEMSLSAARELARTHGYFGEEAMDPLERAGYRQRQGLPLNTTAGPRSMTQLLGGTQTGRQWFQRLLDQQRQQRDERRGVPEDPLDPYFNTPTRLPDLPLWPPKTPSDAPGSGWGSGNVTIEQGGELRTLPKLPGPPMPGDGERESFEPMPGDVGRGDSIEAKPGFSLKIQPGGD